MQNGKHVEALKEFHRVLLSLKMFEKKESGGGFESMALQSRVEITEEEQKEINSLLLSSYLNMSLVYMKQGKHRRATEAISSAMAFQVSVKALVRRASCFLQLEEPEKALEDLIRAEGMEHKEFAVELGDLLKKAKALQEKLLKKSGFMFKNLF